MSGKPTPSRRRIGVCAMEKKARSRPMRAILERLSSHFELVGFSDEQILHAPVEDWPVCEGLISFHSSGFPLEKALAYVNLRRPFCVNELSQARLLLDRREVYRTLEAHGITVPVHAILERDAEGNTLTEVHETDDYITIGGRRINKPFVEKPVDADDHNIHVYYPVSAGGGSKRLFRKVKDRSSQFYPDEHRVRQDGKSYIYEEFVRTQGIDVKVYAVGPDYAHAEARKAPTLDGKVMRTDAGKEVRYPVILSAAEKAVSRKICLAFGQSVCGFDILRDSEAQVPVVCDVNGWSFVKTSEKYIEDCATLLKRAFLTSTLPRATADVLSPAPPPVPPLMSSTWSMPETGAGTAFETTASNVTPQAAAVASPVAAVSSKASSCSTAGTSTETRSSSNAGKATVSIAGISGESTSPSTQRVRSQRAPSVSEELRCVIAVIRHGDRTPKHKIKTKVWHKDFVRLFHKEMTEREEEKAKVKVKRKPQESPTAQGAKKQPEEVAHGNDKVGTTETQDKTGVKFKSVRELQRVYRVVSDLRRRYSSDRAFGTTTPGPSVLSRSASAEGLTAFSAGSDLRTPRLSLVSNDGNEFAMPSPPMGDRTPSGSLMSPSSASAQRKRYGVHKVAVAAAHAAVAVGLDCGAEAAEAAATEAAEAVGASEAAAAAAAAGAVCTLELGGGAAAAAVGAKRVMSDLHLSATFQGAIAAAASADSKSSVGDGGDEGVGASANKGAAVCLQEETTERLQAVVERMELLESAWRKEGGESLDELLQMQEVLERWQFTGINRSVQLKPKSWKDPASTTTLAGDGAGGRSKRLVKKLQLIMKWGGELTDAGSRETELFGAAFRRAFYPGGDGLLRLHATFRHDLKIWSSDEGRVQLTAAAFSKGLLELDGELTPILVTLVNKNNEMLDHSGHAGASSERDIVKERLYSTVLAQGRVPDASATEDADPDWAVGADAGQPVFDEMVTHVAPLHTSSIVDALRRLGRPMRALHRLKDLIAQLTAHLKVRLDRRASVSLPAALPKSADSSEEADDERDELEPLELAGSELLANAYERWRTLEESLFNCKKGCFDLSKIPDVYDMIRFDARHNKTFSFPPRTAFELFELARDLARCLVAQEFGMQASEKYSIGCAVANRLLRKIHDDLQMAKSITRDNQHATSEAHLYQFDSAQAVKHSIKNPGRAIRTRLYFTSESHIHSLLNCLRYGRGNDPSAHLGGGRGLISDADALAFLDRCEYGYLTHIVFQVYEDMAAAIDDIARFRVCVYVSPGIRQLRESDFSSPGAPEGTGLFDVEQPTLLTDSLRLNQVEKHLQECFTFR